VASGDESDDVIDVLAAAQAGKDHRVRRLEAARVNEKFPQVFDSDLAV
jgi:hypothetical protein